MHVNNETNAITVHGREGLNLPYTRWSADKVPTQIDISGASMFIEIPAANLRRQLDLNSNDPKGLRVTLTREDIEHLPTVPTQYIIIDETTDFPYLELEGVINRTGYKGPPSEDLPENP